MNEPFRKGMFTVKTVDDGNNLLCTHVPNIGQALDMVQELPRHFCYYIYDERGNLLVRQREPKIPRPPKPDWASPFARDFL